MVSAIEVNGIHQQCGDAPADNDGDFCGNVFGSILGLEGLGADDIADLFMLDLVPSIPEADATYTVADQVHGGNSGLLGISSHVGRNQGQ